MMRDKLAAVTKYLPSEAVSGIDRLPEKCRENITEIRLRAIGAQSLTLSDGCVMYLSDDSEFCKNPMSYRAFSEEDIANTVTALCEGSVYSFSETVRSGYITKEGIRIGICGKGMMSGGIPDGFCEYTSLNIRIPRHIPSFCDTLLEYIDKNSTGVVGGVLVISPPGAGKTTFLRALGAHLSQSVSDGGRAASFEVCFCDEREELYLPEAFGYGRSEFLSALPKKFCIEHFTRLMNPDYIIIDEIGNGNEAGEILDSASQGICFCASCHGRDVFDVFENEKLRMLAARGVFRTACVLSQNGGTRNVRIVRLEDYL